MKIFVALLLFSLPVCADSENDSSSAGSPAGVASGDAAASSSDGK